MLTEPRFVVGPAPQQDFTVPHEVGIVTAQNQHRIAGHCARQFYV
jgi:hypothetical protein